MPDWEIIVRPGAHPPEGLGREISSEELEDSKVKIVWSGFSAAVLIVLALAAVENEWYTASALLLPFIIASAFFFIVYLSTINASGQADSAKKKIKRLSGVDYVDPATLEHQDRDRARLLQEAVEVILSSPLHRSGKVLDRERNEVVLADLKWQIAKDLQKATTADRKMQDIGIPTSDNPRASTSHKQALLALQKIRMQADVNIEKIAVYSNKVKYAESLLEDEKRADAYGEVFAELEVESVREGQQSEALESLVAAQEAALEVVELHTKMNL
ncbi:hypothetical protein [Nocardiopsis sp. LOL_012]|uniref:hypothetical protein n=1 Tax=Nocardiopsis sp. LOL_012 TaxID=3345409 RepID=UPI003A85803D